MIMLRDLSLPLSLLFVSLAGAQTVQDLWISPAPPDFSTNLTVGETYELRWDSSLVDQFAAFAKTVDPSDTDLWITDYNLHVYAKRIAARQNLNLVTRLSWKVDVAVDDIAATNKWVFRWLQQGVDYADTPDQISSPGFYVQEDTKAAATSSTTSTTSTTSTSSSSSSATTTSTSSVISSATSSAATVSSAPASETSTGSASSSNGGSGLSTGAKAGIGIGAVVGAALLLGLGWFLAKKSSKSKMNITNTPNQTELPLSHSSTRAEAKFPPYSDTPPQTQPVPQYHQVNYAELENTNSHSVPHELGGQGGHRQA